MVTRARQSISCQLNPLPPTSKIVVAGPGENDATKRAILLERK